MVSETTKQPLPSSPSTLCFNKEEFMKDDFHVEDFIVECRRRVQLEMLRDDLGIYLKILQSAMIELINKDYADFVNLSTNLVGMDKAINNLVTPLEHLQDEIKGVQRAISDAVATVDAKKRKQSQIREKKASLQRLMNIIHSVEKMEQLLGLKSSGDGQPIQYTGELSGQLIERVATEFNKLQFYVNKSRGLPLVEEIKPRISNITTMLQYSLEGSFREGLETGNVPILRQCLRTYATIDKMLDAENLFRQHLVKPYMEEVINEQYIRDSQQGLRGMYVAILDFIPKHCRKLREVTAGTAQGSGEVVRGYDFLVNSVWPEVVCNIEARTPSIFAPGNPQVFHTKYSTSMEFIDRFERQCGSQASVKRLRAHPAYNTFMSKWSLPVYFQIRFQEIAGALEMSLMSPFEKAEGDLFQLEATKVTWECLHKCWQQDIYLQTLCHRFWKLSLQILSRYCNWMSEVQNTQLVSEAKKDKTADNGHNQAVRPGSGEPGRDSPKPERSPSPPPVTLSQLVCLIADAQTLADQVPGFYQTSIQPAIVGLGVQSTALFTESLDDSCHCLTEQLPKLGAHIVEDITLHCASHLKLASDIPRMYRRTNREIPNKPSFYMASLVKPLRGFLEEQGNVLKASLKEQWICTVLQSLAEQFYNVTSDVLTSVKKMEESLKRLKKAKTTASDLKSLGQGQSGLSDDDKIRLQLSLDVKDFGKQIEELGVKTDLVPGYGKLVELVESARAAS